MLKGNNKTNIGTKRMGDLDEKVFVKVCKKRFLSEEEAGMKAMELCSVWQENVKNSAWHPFKVVRVNDTHEVCIIKTCSVFLNSYASM